MENPVTRELTKEELDQVTGGWIGPGNPGNLYAVGKAGENPSNNPPRDFIEGGYHEGDNGRTGASAVNTPQP